MPEPTTIAIPNLPPATMDKLKRFGVMLVGAGIIAGSKRLGLDLGPAEIAGISGIIIAYLTGSNWKEAALSRALSAGRAAAEKVNDPAAALAAINRAPQP